MEVTIGQWIRSKNITKLKNNPRIITILREVWITCLPFPRRFSRIFRYVFSMAGGIPEAIWINFCCVGSAKLSIPKPADLKGMLWKNGKYIPQYGI
jgi:hypothetical protein